MCCRQFPCVHVEGVLLYSQWIEIAYKCKQYIFKFILTTLVGVFILTTLVGVFILTTT